MSEYKVSINTIKNVNDDRIKAGLIKDALKIVDKLAETYVGKSMDYDDLDTLEELIDKAKTIKKNRLWKL